MSHKTLTNLFRWIVVAISLVWTFVIMILPSHYLTWMRSTFRPLGVALNRIENSLPYLDMDHVAFFGILAFICCLVLPASRRRLGLLCLPVLAFATELLQLLEPTRKSKISDVRDDLIGIAIGWLTALVLTWLVRRITRLRDSSPASDIPEKWPDRSWLVSLLRHEAGLAMPTDAAQVAIALQIVRDEGVVNLAHDALCARPVDESAGLVLSEAFAKSAHASTARSMWMLEQSRKISRVLSDAKIPAIWLKGVALSQWLYPRPHLRELADVDLLLPDHATALKAVKLLSSIGYILPNPHIAGDYVVRQLLAWSEHAQMELDLHWDISNSALFAGRLSWEEMCASSKSLPGIHEGARGLSSIHATLHACMHRANNFRTGRQNRLRWLYDIHLLAVGFKRDEWDDFSRLAVERGLADPSMNALHACADELGTIVPSDVISQLSNASGAELVRTNRLNRWAYFQFVNWQSLPDLQSRISWFRQLLIPNFSHLRVRYGADGASGSRVVLRRLKDGFARWRRYD